jgi:hypothetical protein
MGAAGISVDWAARARGRDAAALKHTAALPQLCNRAWGALHRQGCGSQSFSIRIDVQPDDGSLYDVYLRSFEAARSINVPVTAKHVTDVSKIEGIIAKLAGDPGGGLIAPGDPFIVVNRDVIMKMAERHRVPAIYTYRWLRPQGILGSPGA